MGKIRHIAYRVDDMDAMAAFFVNGLGMTEVQRRSTGAIDLSDGTINITLLPTVGLGATGKQGIEHIGFTVANEEEAKRAMEAAGATEMNTINMTDVNYEVKYRGPEGIVVDLGHWAGTAPVVEEPIAAQA